MADESERRKAESAKREQVKKARTAERAERSKEEQARRASLVAAALELLGSDGSDRARKRVEYTIVEVERRKEARSSGRYGTLTKDQKTAAAQFAAALKSLESKLNNPNLAFNLRFNFPLDEFDFVRWIARAEAAASKTLNKTNPKKLDQAKLYAAEEALRLLKARVLDAPLTRGGRFLRLTAILHGSKPDALGVDFLHHCRLAKKANENGA